MSTEAEGTFKLKDTSLYSKTWTPTGSIKAKLIFVHGFSDHINCYNEHFRAIATHGIQVFGWDQRGWGHSVTKPSEKGLTGPTSQVVAEIAAFIQDKLPSDVPVFVMGHSMGGGEVLTLAGDAQYEKLVGQIRGWLLEAPFIAFAPEEIPNSLKVFAGRLVARLMPKRQMIHHIPPERLTRDPVIVEALKNDKLCHDTGTLEGLASLLDRTAALASGRVKVGSHVKSMFLAHGNDDKTCSHDGAMKWLEAQQIEDKTPKTYDGAYHQLHTDLCKEEYTKDVVDWILARCGGETAEVDDGLKSKL
ncbi:Fc.00g005900.m01.CDS01 [Cosmosporella sp. VM-42]